jgi:Fe-S-cluster containining protein
MTPSSLNPRKSLLAIYDHFEYWAQEFDFACEKGCATCCTQSVTMTTLEGELIHEYIMTGKPELIALLKNLPKNSPTPATTTNQFAAACFSGKDVDHVTEWNMSPCVFLQNNCCTIYQVRSFMCRSFGSRIRCRESGEAQVDPLFLTLNTVIMQCIEHLDQGRPWGNLNTILRSLTGNKITAPKINNHSKLLAEPIPRFLIPPDEADKLHNQVSTLLGIIKKTKLNAG